MLLVGNSRAMQVLPSRAASKEPNVDRDQSRREKEGAVCRFAGRNALQNRKRTQEDRGTSEFKVAPIEDGRSKPRYPRSIGMDGQERLNRAAEGAGDCSCHIRWSLSFEKRLSPFPAPQSRRAILNRPLGIRRSHRVLDLLITYRCNASNTRDDGRQIATDG